MIPPTSRPDLVGREHELGRLRDLLELARRGSAGALLVTGDAGIGKTSLLDALEADADGFVRLRAHGVESEQSLGHAALLELLGPVRHLLRDLPGPQADALAAAVGWGPAAAPAHQHLVGAATLTLLAAAGTGAPVLVVLDDLHWVDRESAAAVLFAARRLRHDPVTFLLATRAGLPTPVPLDDLDVLTLPGLPAAEAARLLGGRVADDVASRLADQTRGNPLALLEVAGDLTPAQRVGAAPLPDPLPVGPRLEAALGRALTGLSPEAWRAVLLCAAGGDGHGAAPVEALRHAVDDAGAALDEAEAAGVLVRPDGEIRFRHPLLRTAAWRRATPAERRRAHLAQAAALPGDGARAARVWHLALAAEGPDDDLARDLAAVAGVDRARRGYAAASAALQRAAALTTDPGRAGERLAAAVGDAFLAGDLERTRALARRVLDGPAGSRARGQVLGTLGTLEQYAGSVPRAADLLAAAADEAEGGALVGVLTELALTRFRLNDVAGLADCARRIAAAADPADVEQRALSAFVRGFARTVGGDPVAGRPLLAEVLELVETPPLRDDPRFLLHLGLTAGFLGATEVRDIASSAERRLARAREQGALGLLVPALALMAAGRALLGDHRGAFADAGEAVELGEELGFAADTAVAVEMLAWQSAARGLHDDARAALSRARSLTDRAGTTAVHVHQRLTAAHCALARGDPAEVVSLLEPSLTTDGGVGSMGEPLGVAPLLVEAYLAVGRADDAAALAGRFAGVAPAGAAPATTALVARCLAITAADLDDAVAAFVTALDAHARTVDAFEEARTRLLYGSALRRAGRRVAAREQLGLAHDGFAGMDLAAWQRQAADELAATGATARRRREAAPEAAAVPEPLTSQETRVALLVARGLPNRDVAAALFLSPRTVEHHLATIFRKRGYRSRSEVVLAFAAQHPPAGT